MLNRDPEFDFSSQENGYLATALKNNQATNKPKPTNTKLNSYNCIKHIYSAYDMSSSIMSNLHILQQPCEILHWGKLRYQNTKLLPKVIQLIMNKTQNSNRGSTAPGSMLFVILCSFAFWMALLIKSWHHTYKCENWRTNTVSPFLDALNSDFPMIKCLSCHADPEVCSLGHLSLLCVQLQWSSPLEAAAGKQTPFLPPNKDKHFGRELGRGLPRRTRGAWLLLWLLLLFQIQCQFKQSFIFHEVNFLCGHSEKSHRKSAPLASLTSFHCSAVISPWVTHQDFGIRWKRGGDPMGKQMDRKRRSSGKKLWICTEPR